VLGSGAYSGSEEDGRAVVVETVVPLYCLAGGWYASLALVAKYLLPV